MASPSLPLKPSIDSKMAQSPAPLPIGWLSRWPWLTFLLPMIVFMLVGSLEPVPPAQAGSAGNADLVTKIPGQSKSRNTEISQSGEEDLGEEETWLPISYRQYPLIYSLKIALTLLTMVLVWPGYRTFRWHLSPWSLIVGGVGVGLWVGLCHLQLESRLLGLLGLGNFLDLGQRSAFNPLVEMRETPLWANLFLAIRLFGLAVVVPVIEEFFLRGFLLRYVISQQWWEWPFGKVTPMAVIAGTGIPMLMHPGELLAACVWFSLVTWLMVRTRNIWDCVVAHGTTNLLLGIYVITSGQWQLM